MSTLYLAKRSPAELRAGDLLVMFKSPLEELVVDRTISLLYEVVEPGHSVEDDVVSGLSFQIVGSRRVFPRPDDAIQRVRLAAKGRYYATVPPMFATVEAVDPRG